MNVKLQVTYTFTMVHIMKFIMPVLIIITVFVISSELYAEVISGTIEFEGRTRDYKLFLPADYDNMDSLPLILNLHGSNRGFNGAWQMNYTQMNAVADTAGFMVLYPTGIMADGSLGGWFTDRSDPVNGVGFIDALLDTLCGLYKVNEDQIYSCGTSAGGSMSCKLAHELPHRITAIASNAGGISSGIVQDLELKRPMPFLSIHGTMDSYRSAEMALELWIDLNICSEPADTVVLPDTNQEDNCSVEKMTYVNQGAGCKVVHYKVINGGHTWPGSAYDIPSVGNTDRDINANSEIWNFFKQFKLSELSFPDFDVTPRSLNHDLEILPRFINIKPVVFIQNGGLNDLLTIPALFVIDSSGTIVCECSQVFDDMKSMEKKELLFDTVHTLIADEYEFMCISLLADDENVKNDTLKRGIAVTDLIDDFESGDGTQWISDYGWGCKRSSKNANSGDYTLYSKRDRSYKDADTTTAIFFSSFNLSSLETAYISFSSKYDFYEGDAGYTEVSVDQGETWVKTSDTYTGSQDEHKISEIPLDSYVKPDIKELMLRFKVINNPDNGFPLWFIDDVMLHPNEETGAIVQSNRSNIQMDQFVLKDNYPNPFNLSTVIKYTMTRPQEVTIKILNILGQEVATLLNESQASGEYSIVWNGLDHSGHEVNSGVYYCWIQTSDQVFTRKMLLLK